MPKPRKLITSLDAYRRAHSDNVESWKSLYNSVLDLIGPDCPHERFSGIGTLNGNGSGSVRDVGVQSEDPVDGSPVEVVSIPGESNNMTINLDSSSDDESKNHRDDDDSKENVLLESLRLKNLISSLKQERVDDQKSLLHYIVMENLPLKITDGDLERDVFSLVGIDRRSLALNVQRHKTESVVQVYTNDMRQVQKILACDKKVVVGGRVLATRIGTTGRV